MSSNVMAVLHHEYMDCRATGYKRIVHIRVTTDAIQGAPVSVPITPERARVLARLMMVPTQPEPTVVADPMDYETMMEIVMHPADYCDVLKERAPGYLEHSTVDGVQRIMGIPVARV
jgi:hypothetical protein